MMKMKKQQKDRGVIIKMRKTKSAGNAEKHFSSAHTKVTNKKSTGVNVTVFTIPFQKDVLLQNQYISVYSL